MTNEHANAVFDVEDTYFQAICACGWVSTVSFLEEVDLLRALHAHFIVVYGEPSGNTDLSTNLIGLDELPREGRDA